MVLILATWTVYLSFLEIKFFLEINSKAKENIVYVDEIAFRSFTN